ncbi:MAG TPA: acetylglutamate kinase [Coriobacteriia bacterium]
MKDLLTKAATLTEALPWIKSTWGSTVVVKYGGAAMIDPALRGHVASDLVLMKLVGINPVIVHGGGPDITAYMDRLEMPVEFIDGLRITDDAAMEVVKMVLVGKVNKELVSAINRHGRLAVGIAGDDANLIKARPISEALGRVGEVEAIDATVVTALIEDGFIPVIATVGYGDDGGSYNINADLVAAEVAIALGAAKVIFLTDVDGLYADFADKGSLISALSMQQAESLIAEDRLSSGMIPKVGACARALRHGVPRAHILNGTVPHALLLEVFTDEGVGTMITSDGGQPVAHGSAHGPGRGEDR